MAKTLNVGDDADLIPTLGLALGDPDATEIVLHPGVYVEHIVIEPRDAPLLIRSSTGVAEDVVLTFGLRQGDRDRTGMEFVQSCATMTIDADAVTIRQITIENSFDRLAHPELPNVQALALRTRGDDVLIEGCRLLGRQDTVLLDAPSFAAWRRVHLRDCEIQGDVDFVYGRATALIEGGVLRSVGPGYIAAPSTARENPRGFLLLERGRRRRSPGRIRAPRPPLASGRQAGCGRSGRVRAMPPGGAHRRRAVGGHGRLLLARRAVRGVRECRRRRRPQRRPTTGGRGPRSPGLARRPAVRHARMAAQPSSSRTRPRRTTTMTARPARGGDSAWVCTRGCRRAISRSRGRAAAASSNSAPWMRRSTPWSRATSCSSASGTTTRSPMSGTATSSRSSSRTSAAISSAPAPAAGCRFC